MGRVHHDGEVALFSAESKDAREVLISGGGATTKTTTKTQARKGGEGDDLNISSKGVCSTDASEFDCCVMDCSPP